MFNSLKGFKVPLIFRASLSPFHSAQIMKNKNKKLFNLGHCLELGLCCVVLCFFRRILLLFYSMILIIVCHAIVPETTHRRDSQFFICLLLARKGNSKTLRWPQDETPIHVQLVCIKSMLNIRIEQCSADGFAISLLGSIVVEMISSMTQTDFASSIFHVMRLLFIGLVKTTQPIAI